MQGITRKLITLALVYDMYLWMLDKPT